MHIEQERKFLVSSLPTQDPDDTRYVLQGYLNPGSGVRVRFLLRTMKNIADRSVSDITAEDVERIIVGVKQDTPDVSRRFEEEHVYDSIFFQNFRDVCSVLLLKTRHEYIIEGVRWEIDVYHEEHEGIMVAEIEYEGEVLPQLPSFCGPDVTDDPFYRNENLAY